MHKEKKKLNSNLTMVLMRSHIILRRRRTKFEYPEFEWHFHLCVEEGRNLCVWQSALRFASHSSLMSIYLTRTSKHCCEHIYTLDLTFWLLLKHHLVLVFEFGFGFRRIGALVSVSSRDGRTDRQADRQACIIMMRRCWEISEEIVAPNLWLLWQGLG